MPSADASQGYFHVLGKPEVIVTAETRVFSATYRRIAFTQRGWLFPESHGTRHNCQDGNKDSRPERPMQTLWQSTKKGTHRELLHRAKDVFLDPMKDMLFRNPNQLEDTAQWSYLGPNNEMPMRSTRHLEFRRQRQPSAGSAPNRGDEEDQ